jgi:transcriptional regulator with XRE-family HTH domain
MNMTQPELLNPAQIRAARALLAWSQQDLARQARVAASTVADFERGHRTPVTNNADAMRMALESAGISFLPGGAVIGPAPTRTPSRQGGNPVRWVDATDLAQWAERRAGQGSMPELLTRLIRAATGAAAQINFPSDESVQFPGWDGTCEIPSVTVQIPSGSSAWEIGTQRTKIAEKADDDYAKRTTEPLGLIPREATFVFVTPRRWTKKRQWAAAKRAEKNGATCGRTTRTIWFTGSSFIPRWASGWLPLSENVWEVCSNPRKRGKSGRCQRSNR